MDERPVSPVLKLCALAMFVFLLAPLVVVVPLSLSGDSFMAFPPSSWSTKWYPAVFADRRMVAAFETSVALAAVVTALSVAIALPAAYALVRLRPRGGEVLSSLFTAPLLLPTIVLGLAILIVFARMGLLATFPGLVAAHLVVTLPYALRVLATALSTMPIAIEEAAATLGASSPHGVLAHHLADDAVGAGRDGGAVFPRLVRRGGAVAVPDRAAHLDLAGRDVSPARAAGRPARRGAVCSWSSGRPGYSGFS